MNSINLTGRPPPPETRIARETDVGHFRLAVYVDVVTFGSLGYMESSCGKPV